MQKHVHSSSALCLDRFSHQGFCRQWPCATHSKWALRSNSILNCIRCSLQDPEEFFNGDWEQQPAVLKATPERIALFQGLCSYPAVINWLKQREKKSGPLEFGADVNAARYKDGVRETPNGEVGSGVAPLHEAGQPMYSVATCCSIGKQAMHDGVSYIVSHDAPSAQDREAATAL